MPTYNKLVRDKIPAIIDKSGKTYTTKILSEPNYKQDSSTPTLNQRF